MASYEFLCIKSVTGKNGVLVALKHNKRELQFERGAQLHIDTSRTPLNYALHGNSSADSIAKHAKAQMAYAGIDIPRKNAVMAVEIVFSLPVTWHDKDTSAYFTDCYTWVLSSFNAELLSFDVHLDESAPHAHALILPLMDGKLQGDKLKGDRANIKRLRKSYFEAVASKHGFVKTEKQRINQRDKPALVQQIFASLNNDAVKRSSIWPWVRDLIHADPLPVAELLGVKFINSAPKIKSFVEYKRARGKGTFVK